MVSVGTGSAAVVDAAFDLRVRGAEGSEGALMVYFVVMRVCE